MSKSAELGLRVDGILSAPWSIREGVVVPETEGVALKNGGVKLDATFLYADLADSTGLAERFDARVAGKIVRSFLACATYLIRSQGGSVRSFDGDRVMGVFVGDRKNTSAAICAFQINYAVRNLVRKKAEAKYETLRAKGFVVTHCTGIHTSNVFVVRGGVRESNDLVFIGAAPNIAAGLSEIRNGDWRTYITDAVYRRLLPTAKFANNGQAVWTKVTRKVAGVDRTVCKATYWREP